MVYVADQRVGAVFIFNTETRDCQMIRNGIEAHFGWINGLAIDDDDRLFVSDGKMHRVLIFNPSTRWRTRSPRDSWILWAWPSTRPTAFFTLSTRSRTRSLCMTRTLSSCLRRIGTGGKNHFLTTPGDFGAPQGVAVDADGNVYVTDTLNNRVEIFDADGNFLSTFGKAGDGPGYSSRVRRESQSMGMGTSGSPTKCRTACRYSTAMDNC